MFKDHWTLTDKSPEEFFRTYDSTSAQELAELRARWQFLIGAPLDSGMKN